MVKKRAQMTQAQLVGIILLGIGFVVILFFYPRLGITKNFDRDNCHSSVMMKSTQFSIFGQKVQPLKGLISSKCKTEAVEITTTNVVEIEKQLAEWMRLCWWMLGKGEVDFLSEFGGERTCLICSEITFNKAVQGKVPSISGAAFYDFLDTSFVLAEEKTYLQYFTASEHAPLKTEYEFKDIDSTKVSLVIFTLAKKSWLINLGRFVSLQSKEYGAFVNLIPSDDLGEYGCTSFASIPSS